MKARIRVGHRCRRIITKGQGSSFVMGGAQTVTPTRSRRDCQRGLAGGNRPEVSTRQHLIRPSIGKDHGHIFSRPIHRLPQQTVLCRWVDRYKAAWDVEFVEFGSQGHAASRVAGARLADPANSDDNLLIVHVVEVVDRIDIGDLFEQFGFGIGCSDSPSRRQ